MNSNEKGYGNDGAVESEEKQKQLFHASHRPLEISPKARDSHIPTASLHPVRAVENQNQVSHCPPVARHHLQYSFPTKTKKKTKKGSQPLRGFFSIFQDHAALETKPRFRIILGLENAPAGGS